MTQAHHLLGVLKTQLKVRNITYAMIAESLALSEASIKRLFSSGDMSLSRLEAIASLAQLSLGDLVELAERKIAHRDSLDYLQEQQLASDTRLLLVAVCVINGLNFDQIRDQYRFAEAELFRLLARLDSVGIIELLPQNRIRLLLSPLFRWLPNGPIQRYFHDKVKQEFFQSSFNAEQDQLLVINGLLSTASNQRLQQKMQRLAQEFADAARADKRLPRSQCYGNTLVLAVRHWQPQVFKDLAK